MLSPRLAQPDHRESDALQSTPLDQHTCVPFGRSTHDPPECQRVKKPKLDRQTTVPKTLSRPKSYPASSTCGFEQGAFDDRMSCIAEPLTLHDQQINNGTLIDSLAPPAVGASENNACTDVSDAFWQSPYELFDSPDDQSDSLDNATPPLIDFDMGDVINIESSAISDIDTWIGSSICSPASPGVTTETIHDFLPVNFLIRLKGTTLVPTLAASTLS